MTLEIEKAERLPFLVDYVVVTPENIEEAAEWCKGTIRTRRDDDAKYIKIDVTRPANARQTQAFAGDYILHTITGFRIYGKVAFEKSFRHPVVYTEANAEDQLVDYPDGAPTAEAQTFNVEFVEPVSDAERSELMKAVRE